MIKDAQGRKWLMRFKYRDQPFAPRNGALRRFVASGRVKIVDQRGWHWEARHEDHGQSSWPRLFATKALAEANARKVISSRDSIAESVEYFRRLEQEMQ